MEVTQNAVVGHLDLACLRLQVAPVVVGQRLESNGFLDMPPSSPLPMVSREIG
jgi:hypothetical protein